jgi:hypothetical protein
MITSVAYKPVWLSTAYNPITWSVLSDKIAEIDFQYVIDVYVNGTKVTRIKQRPNPAGYGLWDVGTIVQSYLGISKFSQGELESNDTQWFWTNQEASAHVYCLVGEQYGATGTIYNGNTNTPGNPAFKCYSVYSNAGAGLTDVPVRVIAGSLENHQWLWNMQQPSTGGIWSSDPFTTDANGNITYDHTFVDAGKLAYPLSLDRLERDVFTFDKATVSFINWTPGLGLETANTPDKRTIYAFRYTIVDPQGTSTVYNIIPTTANGFGPKTACSTALTNQLDNSYDLIHLQMSPDRIATLTGLNIGPGWTIKVHGRKVLNLAACTIGAQVTQEVTFNVKEYCEYLWPRVRLSWLNELGARDYWNFTMLSEKTIETQEEQYFQDIMEWSGSLPIPQLNSTTPFGRMPMIGGNKVYNKTATTSYKLATDWLDQEQVNLLESLQKSPQVLAYIHKGNQVQVPGVKAKIVIKFTGWNTEGTSETTSGISVTTPLGNLSFTVPSGTPYGTFADDWIQDVVIPILNASGFNTNYGFSSALATATDAIVVIEADLVGPSYSFLTNTPNSVQVLSVVAGSFPTTGEGSTIYDEFPYTCKITNKSYRVRNVKQEKIFSAEFEIELSQTQTMQNA